MNNLTAANPGLYFYYYDGLGSVAALSNTSGNIVEGYTGACPGPRSGNAFGKGTIHATAGSDGIWLNGDPVTLYRHWDSAYGNPYMFTGRRGACPGLDPGTPNPACTTTAPASTAPASDASSRPIPSATTTP